MKKVWIAGLLILALCLSLVACGGSTAEPTEAPVETETLDPNSVAGKLAAVGFAESDLLFGADDYIEIDENGDYSLYTTASYEEVAKAVYNACKKADDDGEARDYWSEEPVDFTFDESSYMDIGYNLNGEFMDVLISPIYTDEETGVTEYLLQWD